jgi:hypothetical protein
MSARHRVIIRGPKMSGACGEGSTRSGPEFSGAPASFRHPVAPKSGSGGRVRSGLRVTILPLACGICRETYRPLFLTHGPPSLTHRAASLGALRSPLAEDQVHGCDYDGRRDEEYREAKQRPLPPRQFHVLLSFSPRTFSFTRDAESSSRPPTISLITISAAATTLTEPAI